MQGPRAGRERRAGALFCGSFLRKGEVLAYVRRIHNLKDLTAGARAPAEAALECNAVRRAPERSVEYSPTPGGGAQKVGKGLVALPGEAQHLA